MGANFLVKDNSKRVFSDASSGHLGIVRTLAYMQECFYQPVDYVRAVRGSFKKQIYNAKYLSERSV